jgi:hypothetical protein
MRQPPTPQVLHGLVDKYERLLRLRTEPTEVAPRDELRSLARQFPGALRELDRLPLETIETRLAALRRVLADATEPETWMGLQASYHGYMRATLRVKRWSRAWPRDPAAALLAFTAKYVPAPDEPGLGYFDEALLVKIRKPPAGRLNPLVIEAVARVHETTVEVVAEALCTQARRQ